MECYSAIKREWNLAICDMKEHRVYYAKQNKSEKDKYSTISLVCGIVKTKHTAYIRKQKKSHRYREQMWLPETRDDKRNWEGRLRLTSFQLQINE